MTATLDLNRLEELVQHALATRDETALHVLGYGEIGCVIAWPTVTGPWACKRLPVFDSADRFDAYCAVFRSYVDALRTRGVAVHDTQVGPVALRDGRLAAYCIQSALPPQRLGPALLARAGPDEARTLLGAIMGHISAASGSTVGLDAQVSNWGRHDGELVYFDLTTPLLRDEHGQDLLDTDLFLASLPALLRPVVRRFLLGDILDPYFAPRSAALDLLANLHREHLGQWVPLGVELANEHLGTDLDAEEVRRHYGREARMWSGLQRLRRLDRVWQRRVRRRIYPFLLPGRIHRPRARVLAGRD
jgi:hypothetical protein